MMGLGGNLVTTRSGMLSLDEFAVGLSRLPRFAGQTVVPWTVAHHLLVCRQLSLYRPDLAVHALLHDAHEAMTGDIPTTFKTRDLKRSQRRLDARIYSAFNVPLPTMVQAKQIKEIDSRALLAEAAMVTPTATYKRICLERGSEAREQDTFVVERLMTHPDDARHDLLHLLEFDIAKAAQA